MLKINIVLNFGVEMKLCHCENDETNCYFFRMCTMHLFRNSDKYTSHNVHYLQKKQLTSGQLNLQNSII